MRRQRTMNPGQRGGLLALAAALALAGGGLATTMEPVGAAFPGRNGKIAFFSDRITAENPTGDYEIITINPDGTGLRQVTTNTTDDLDPAWSADGKRIAFTSVRDGNPEVYTMAVNGGSPTNRTSNGAADFEPDWQPKRRR